MTSGEQEELRELTRAVTRLEGVVGALVRALTGTVPPSPEEAAEVAAVGRPCPACSRNGAPVSNCPMCRGTGIAPSRRD